MKKLKNLFKSKKQVRINSIENQIKLFQSEPLNCTFTKQYQENEINRLKTALSELN